MQFKVETQHFKPNPLAPSSQGNSIALVTLLPAPPPAHGGVLQGDGGHVVLVPGQHLLPAAPLLLQEGLHSVQVGGAVCTAQHYGHSLGIDCISHFLGG